MRDRYDRGERLVPRQRSLRRADGEDRLHRPDVLLVRVWAGLQRTAVLSPNAPVAGRRKNERVIHRPHRVEVRVGATRILLQIRQILRDELLGVLQAVSCTTVVRRIADLEHVWIVRTKREVAVERQRKPTLLRGIGPGGSAGHRKTLFPWPLLPFPYRRHVQLEATL